MSQVDSEVGQSTIIEIHSDIIPITLGLMANLRMLTCKTLKCHISALP